jgi:hypothetical protein
MALVDAGYVLPSRTVLYDAPVDTAAPLSTLAALDTPGAPWVILGHVGDETGDGDPSFTRDGGDVTTKGSMTKKSIRQVVEPVVTGIDVDITQFTRGVLAFYHGTSGGTTAGSLQVEGASDGLATERAMLIVWEDGQTRVALYAPRVSWTGRDAIDTTSIEDAIRVPLHAGFLDSNTVVGPTGKPLRYTWLSPTLFPLS